MGNAARNGMLAALFAQQGYEGAPAAIEGPLGWARAMGDVPDMVLMLDDLGQRWEIARNTYKPYPAGIVFHAVIDAALALRAELGTPAPEAIAGVEVAGDALLLARGDRGKVRIAGDQRVSIHHCAAVALQRGRAGVADFAADALTDPVLDALRDRVSAVLDTALPRGAARVQHEAYVEHPRGSAERPLSDAELAEKYRANAKIGATISHVEEQIAALWALDQAPSITPLMALLRGG